MVFQRFLIILYLSGFFLLFSCDSTFSKKKKEKKESGWIVNESGDSVYMRYNEEQRLESFTTYKNGLKNGLAKKFYDNGKTEFEIFYENGLKEGLTKWYHRNGNLYRETTYKNDAEEGIQKKYYEEGKLMAEIPYKNGVVCKGLKEYTKSGKLKQVYPDLIIEPIDKLAFENKYTLRCYLKGKPKGTDYFRVIQNVKDNSEFYLKLEQNNGSADVDFFLGRGDYVFQKVTIRAEFKTTLNNIYVVEKDYNLAIDN